MLDLWRRFPGQLQRLAKGFPLMHTGEEWFQLGWQQYAVFGILVAVYLVLTFANKLPAMDAFKNFLDAINSAGGHIFILSIFTLLSIKVSMQFIYHTMGLPGDVVTKNQAVIGQGISYVTGVLTGSFLGALLKTMSGGKANGNGGSGPSPDAIAAQFATVEKNDAK
jgi:hypothetical protein